MAIVATGVTESGDGRGVRFAAEVVHREGIHISTERKARPGAVGADIGDDTGAGDTSANFNIRESFQPFSHFGSGTVLIKGCFGMSVQVATQSDYLWQEGSQAFGKGIIHILHPIYKRVMYVRIA